MSRFNSLVTIYVGVTVAQGEIYPPREPNPHQAHSEDSGAVVSSASKWTRSQCVLALRTVYRGTNL